VSKDVLRYHVASSISDALDRWNSVDRALFIGGATALQLDWSESPLSEFLIDVSGLGSGLPCGRNESTIELCAFSPLERIRQEPLVTHLFPALAYALGHIGSFGVRSMGTLAGNLCWRKGDLRPLLLAADANVVTTAGPMLLSNWLENGAAGDLLLKVILPISRGTMIFEKVGYRRRFSPSCVTIGCVTTRDDIRLAVGGGNNRTARLYETEAALRRGRKLCRDDLTALIAAEDVMQADAEVTALEKAEIVANVLRGALIQSAFAQ
jgi:CO/xanthine dehydrogenase FAD-binding subunit